ncbi:MAG: hypothetical protein A3C85_02340 [Candidatus Doudnabacteria bacterium RIFCSPHIGHO2_02_FULL_48_21]|uniref:Dihydrolipoyl dehydrogenase n=1 Tax=Candidatus Doudnabacteria bacterium RIFCSPLOWO2_02_FULL_48_13 TaxID=1817845 RepID=A0A1F5QB82_9BACT|nr:MAG: hypothetical protein A3K05_04540 [Candidatus Doudnabacteria bacterium RIFCSPHIGHO2_01_48_18]OGE79949.1 MAG: hypothetical protein A2668_01940 [Candidatus Doudnabacteria bacterium RIFCSPHIGHO2_01_FULL_48_180]OGE90966.1 MAG: hypothetical protein A3F44_02615 [Candidatus Doudnabacteria bacterium RIFCSPHIGHO2_12_FULL_47_25]OGE93461.1 MAG: hypothetical protein A3C85_02340 [Candidatus Doudnabacteria bacterium RIFCSPHIGHO2_02_FULL_48_21]OGE96296.1 MAG: hypothetical protein A3A83_04740 [Candidatu
MNKYDYDVISIGSGSAGGSAAFVAKRAGMKVAIVEEFKDRLGGHCPNYACVPTKAWLKAAEIYKMAKRAGEFGVILENPSVDFQKFAAYRDEVIGLLTGSRIERNLHNAGIELLWGKARFVSDHELEIGEKKYSFNHAVIGTGSKEFIPPIPGLAESGYWTSDIAVKAGDLPESFVVIGGGPIGTEFTEIFTSFGRPVTLLQREPQILQREDKDIADYVQKELEHRGVHIILDCEIIDVTRAGSYKIIRGRAGGREFNVEGAEILVATGRRANLDLNLEAAGVKVTPQGRLELNEYLQTSQAHIWAAGDAAGNWQFTHTAAYEGDLVGRNICHRHDEKTNYDVVPRVTFCDPEVASVGITEAQAKTKNIPYKAGTYKIGGLGRYLINRDSRGFIKLIVEPSSGLILGGHVVGESAGQLLHEIALAMKAKIPVTTMARMIHAYPTFSEAVGAAAENLTAQR